jgi:hypothetical protein
MGSEFIWTTIRGNKIIGKEVKGKELMSSETM